MRDAEVDEVRHPRRVEVHVSPQAEGEERGLLDGPVAMGRSRQGGEQERAKAGARGAGLAQERQGATPTSRPRHAHERAAHRARPETRTGRSTRSSGWPCRSCAVSTAPASARARPGARGPLRSCARSRRPHCSPSPPPPGQEASAPPTPAPRGPAAGTPAGSSIATNRNEMKRKGSNRNEMRRKGSNGNETNRNEMKRNGTNRNETKRKGSNRNETNRNETKRNGCDTRRDDEHGASRRAERTGQGSREGFPPHDTTDYLALATTR